MNEFHFDTEIESSAQSVCVCVVRASERASDKWFIHLFFFLLFFIVNVRTQYECAKQVIDEDVNDIQIRWLKWHCTHFDVLFHSILRCCCWCSRFSTAETHSYICIKITTAPRHAPKSFYFRTNFQVKTMFRYCSNIGIVIGLVWFYAKKSNLIKIRILKMLTFTNRHKCTAPRRFKFIEWNWNEWWWMH